MGDRERVVGVDAGGTGTRGVLFVDGVIEARFADGPMNALIHADVVDRLATHVRDHRADRIGVGLPGVRTGEQGAALAAALTEAAGVPATVTSDAHAALAGAFAGGPGGIVIAGTGSIALASTSDGRTARAGGHGFLLGDEGGGYWIGRRAVSASLAARDGTGPATRLVELVPRVLRRDLDSVVAWVHRNPTDRQALAALVPQVARCAAEGDLVAAEIFTAAAEALARLATAVRTRLGEPNLPIAPVGGVFRVPVMRGRFVTLTGAAEPKEPPEVGAARLAVADGQLFTG